MMAIRSRDLPRILIERVEAAHPEPAKFDADEVEEWPPDAVARLLSGGSLKPSGRANSIECDGCDWRCRKAVVVRQRPARTGQQAFILCDEEPNLGRITVPNDRLRRFRVSIRDVETTLRGELASKFARFKSLPSPFLGIIKGRNGDRPVSTQFSEGVLMLVVGQQRDPLVHILVWDAGLTLSRTRIQHMANRKEPPVSSPRRYQKNSERQRRRVQQTRERDATIVRAAKRLLSEGKSQTAASAEIAKMDFIGEGQTRPISAARVRRILAARLQT